MIKKKGISQKDLNTWNDYIKNPTDIIDKDKAKITSKTKFSRFKFDLHGFTLNDANRKVKELVLNCVEKKCKEILLITGKGIHSKNKTDVYSSQDYGKLRYSVPEYLNSDPYLSKYVSSISNANKSEGGEGAILIKLKNL